MHFKKILITFFLILLCTFSFRVFFKKDREENTLNFWTVQLKAPAGDLIQKNIDEFQKARPNVKIVWVDIPISEIKKRTIASILGGNPPDLVNLNPEFSVFLAQKGALEYFTKEDAAPFNKGLVEKLKFEDKIYALPFYATSAVTILNREKFKDCDVELKTYEDILKLKACKNPPVYGVALNEGDTFAKILSKYKDGTGENLGKVYSLFYEMNKEGLLLKDTLTINHREAVEKYMAESAGFINAGSNFITMIKQNAPGVYKNSVVLPQLTGDLGEYDISIMNFIIPKKSKNKDLAKEFAKLLLNENNQIELAKKTNVLPANQRALDNSYFKNCADNPVEKSRCISSSQLNFPVKKDFGYKNRNEINEIINEKLELLFLKDEKIDLKKTLDSLGALMSN